MSKLITEEEFLEGCLKLAPPNSKQFKFEKDGRTYYHIGEPNLDLLAKLLLKYIKWQWILKRGYSWWVASFFIVVIILK